MTDIDKQEQDEIVKRYHEIQRECTALRQNAPLIASDFEIIAVSKRQPEARIRALLEAGHRTFGENRWQEGHERWDRLKQDYNDCVLHFIGPLQSNKAAEVVSFFDAIHSVDRPKLAKVLAKEMKEQARSVACFIQVNIGEEPQKAGVSPQEADDFIAYCKELDLPVVGLMCIPPAELNPAPHFALLREIAARHKLPRLSMGMSSDWKTALRLGATDIRIGSGIFGERPSEE